MGISDILTLIGLLFAIFAFIYEADGEFIFIKFDWLDITIVIFGFFGVNYFMFHTFYLENGWYLSILYQPWGLKPATWSYILSLFVVSFLFYRIFFGDIPFSNRERLISFYQRLLNKGEFSKTMGYIEKYHEKSILEYHSISQKNETLRKKEYDAADTIGQIRLMRGRRKYKNQTSYTRQQILAANVYHQIIERDDFVSETSNGFPYFYSEIVKCFNYKSISNEESVGWYMTSLISQNNRPLRRELTSNENAEDGQPYNYRLENGNQILRSLLLDLKVAESTFVWKPFGETAIREIRSLKSNHFLFSSYESELYPESKFFELSVFKSVRFFDIMIRRTIYKKHDYHMWLPYYYHIANAIVKRTSDENFDVEDWGRDYPLNFLFVLYRMLSNLHDWYHAMQDALSAGHTNTISKTMSGILLEIANSVSIDDKWKVNQFDLMIRIYCEVSTEPSKAGREAESEATTKSIVESIEKVMINPEYAAKGQTKNYHAMLKVAWQRFDRIPYEETTALDNLENNVFAKI